jgi:hypothetical protein
LDETTVSKERPIMAKVQKYKARRDEHLGEERAMRKRFYDGNYSGLDSARHLEKRDSQMINEDHSAPANLPQNVMIKYWPKAGHYADYALNDDISGINEQMDEDGSEMMRHKGGNKW